MVKRAADESMWKRVLLRTLNEHITPYLLKQRLRAPTELFIDSAQGKSPADLAQEKSMAKANDTSVDEQVEEQMQEQVRGEKCEVSNPATLKCQGEDEALTSMSAKSEV